MCLGILRVQAQNSFEFSLRLVHPVQTSQKVSEVISRAGKFRIEAHCLTVFSLRLRGVPELVEYDGQQVMGYRRARREFHGPTGRRRGFRKFSVLDQPCNALEQL